MNKKLFLIYNLFNFLLIRKKGMIEMIKKMVSKLFFLVLSMFFLFLISCSKNGAESKKGVENKKYNKIVVLDPAAIEMVYLLGAEDEIVGVAKLERSKIWPEDKVAKLESVGTFSKPSLEKIISLKPDLVITAFHTTEEFESGLKANNIEVKKIQANSVEDIFSNFSEIAKLLGKENEANKIIAEKRAKLEEIKKMEKTEKKGIFVLSASPLMVFAKGTLPNDIMKLLNIKNVAENMEGKNPVVSTEFLIKENPEIIITMIPNPNEIAIANPQLKDVAAVKNNKYIVVDSAQILRGSPRTIDHIIDIYEKLKKSEK